ncbi:hypothetical protein J6590_001976 [Homalodisca vitripennis]|nr:hypothetical protein J6590_001976 [Homalodisca vitripennis]
MIPEPPFTALLPKQTKENDEAPGILLQVTPPSPLQPPSSLMWPCCVVGVVGLVCRIVNRSVIVKDLINRQTRLWWAIYRNNIFLFLFPTIPSTLHARDISNNSPFPSQKTLGRVEEHMSPKACGSIRPTVGGRDASGASGKTLQVSFVVARTATPVSFSPVLNLSAERIEAESTKQSRLRVWPVPRHRMSPNGSLLSSAPDILIHLGHNNRPQAFTVTDP